LLAFKYDHVTEKIWSHKPHIWSTEIFQKDTKNYIH